MTKELSEYSWIKDNLRYFEEGGVIKAEKSYAVQKRITDPTQEFVVEKLGNVENVSVIACVTEDNDPNGYLGTEGGYTDQIFFSSPLLKTETISENELLVF